MAKRISPAQLRSQMRQAQNKQRQAINKYNSEVRKYNQKVKRSVDEYNREVRSHNARVRTNRQKLKNELARLNRNSTVRYKVVYSSAVELNASYERINVRESEFENLVHGNEFLDLAETENAFSLQTANELEDPIETHNPQVAEDLDVKAKLAEISADLTNRYAGAVYSLSKENPDASRHFCTSSREIFIDILDIHAPNKTILAEFPDCAKTEKGEPTRRWKIKHILNERGLDDEEAVNFVDKDVNNILELFGVFNAGTHGDAGTYTFDKLLSIKKRVEKGIVFLSEICKYSKLV